MKRLLLLLCLVFSMAAVNAQEYYCYVTVKAWTQDFVAMKVSAYVEMGIEGKDNYRLLCPSDTTDVFPSLTALYNHMSKHGWEYVESRGDDTLAPTYDILMRKKALSVEKAVEGLILVNSEKANEIRKAKKKQKREKRKKEFDESGADSMYY